MRDSSTKKDKIYFILGIVFIILLWLVSSYVVNNTIAIPKISSTFIALKNMLAESKTYMILGLTILKIVMVILTAFVISLILVILATRFKHIESFISPTMSLFRTIPVAVIILLLLFLFGRNNAPIYVSLLMIIPHMYEAMLSGIKSIDKNLIEETKMLSKTNFYVIRKVYLPLTYHYAILSILQSIGLGLKVLVMAELIAQAKNSIGYEMSYYRTMLDMEYVLAWGILMVVIVIISEIIIKRVKKNIIKY